MNEIREKLAQYSHDSAWSGWMKYMFSKGYYKPLEITQGQGKQDGVQQCWVMPRYLVERWQRQMDTLYVDLPESEKESDRAEADKMLAILDPDKLAAQAAWIPVFEWVPEDGVLVMIGNAAEKWVETARLEDNGRWYNELDQHVYPTHWQPLPPPPKDET